MAALSPEEVDAIEADVLATMPPTLARGRGHPSTIESTVISVRPINASDVAAALAHEASGQTLEQNRLKRVAHRHHRMAQLLAGGMHVTKVARVCGIEQQRLSHLANQDPAFMELVAYYKANVDDEFADFVTAAKELSEDILDEIRARLDDEKTTVSFGQLLEAVKVLADRSGNAPTQKNVNVNVNVDLADKMRRARERRLQAENLRNVTPRSARRAN